MQDTRLPTPSPHGNTRPHAPHGRKHNGGRVPHDGTSFPPVPSATKPSTTGGSSHPASLQENKGPHVHPAPLQHRTAQEPHNDVSRPDLSGPCNCQHRNNRNLSASQNRHWMSPSHSQASSHDGQRLAHEDTPTPHRFPPPHGTVPGVKAAPSPATAEAYALPPISARCKAPHPAHPPCRTSAQYKDAADGNPDRTPSARHSGRTYPPPIPSGEPSKQNTCLTSWHGTTRYAPSENCKSAPHP